MADEKLVEAAKLLYASFSQFSWFKTVGAGKNKIFIYVRSIGHKELVALSGRWMGYPVEIKIMGDIIAQPAHETGFSRIGLSNNIESESVNACKNWSI